MARPGYPPQCVGGSDGGLGLQRQVAAFHPALGCGAIHPIAGRQRLIPDGCCAARPGGYPCLVFGCGLGCVCLGHRTCGHCHVPPWLPNAHCVGVCAGVAAWPRCSLQWHTTSPIPGRDGPNSRPAHGWVWTMPCVQYVHHAATIVRHSMGNRRCTDGQGCRGQHSWYRSQGQGLTFQSCGKVLLHTQIIKKGSSTIKFAVSTM